MTHRRLSLGEVFGLTPLSKRLSEAAFMLKGDPYTPPSRFGVSSLNILQPRLSLSTWLGRRRADRRVPLYNLFNRTPTPIEDGWSVRVTQVRDYRGKARTYDSHNGTDFAVPVGVVVTAAAPGRVIRVCNEFHRGGLKVLIDHGRGLVTTSNHLGRALVEVGQRVARGEPVALSGASGVDMVAAFPWSAPHVHYNVWLNGKNIDPFAEEGEASIWRDRNDPRPYEGPPDGVYSPSEWDHDAVDAAIAGCRDVALRARLEAVEDAERRAADLLFNLNYFPTRFEDAPHLYAAHHERHPALDLPFLAEDFVGIVHLDE